MTSAGLDALNDAAGLRLVGPDLLRFRRGADWAATSAGVDAGGEWQTRPRRSAYRLKLPCRIEFTHHLAALRGQAPAKLVAARKPK